MAVLHYHNQCDTLPNKKGLLVLEHKPSGILFAKATLNTEHELRWILTELDEKRCSCRRLQELHNSSPVYRVMIHPVDRIDDAKRMYRQYLQSKRDQYFTLPLR